MTSPFDPRDPAPRRASDDLVAASGVDELTADTGVVAVSSRVDALLEGDRVIVEGREWSTTADGTPWPDNRVSTGQFCSVFAFRGDLISSGHIYVDPHFTSSHTEKVTQLHRG